MNPEHRPDLPPAPPAIDQLPVDRGYPVPSFVAWVGGRPEFRAMDARKLARAVAETRCWVCGRPINGHRVTFVVGPMCVVNRVSAEPPSHRVCAEYSVRACPFLSRPGMTRRENDMPASAQHPAGVMIRRNPGVTCLWTTRTPGATVIKHESGILFQLWPATSATFWREGRLATRAEVLASVESGLPALLDMAVAEGTGAVLALDRMVADAAQYWPAEAAEGVASC